MGPTAPSVERPRPEVILDFAFEGGLLYVVFRNIGTRPALNVRTRVTPPVKGLGGTQELSSLAIFENIEFFAPGKEIRFLLDSSAAYFDRKEPAAVTAQLDYRDAEGTPYKTLVRHNLEIYRSLAYVVR